MLLYFSPGRNTCASPITGNFQSASPHIKLTKVFQTLASKTLIKKGKERVGKTLANKLASGFPSEFFFEKLHAYKRIFGFAAITPLLEFFIELFVWSFPTGNSKLKPVGL